MEIIDLSSFKKAINSLNEVIIKYNENKDDLIVRDSMIQRFEYTYSLALKMLKRYFSKSAFVLENIEDMTFNNMIRTAGKMGLVSELEKWDNFRKMRNLTSHTYDENVAAAVVSVIKDFYDEVENLCENLDKKING
ncbi:nucleotidyltransferase substrate binding protein [bacterium]|nr:nucleotidyltransferase substrate binding protein [bacterium]